MTTANARTVLTDRLVTLARFDSYAGAQRLVDQLSDAKFPVENIRIVGNGVRTVEDVTGRMSKGRAALYGAGTGAWIGLFVALLFLIFTIGPVWWGVLLTTVPLAALFGALAGFIGHWATGGHRDFSSVQSIQADEYEVQVDAGLHEEALRLAAQNAR
ncbi:TIGR04086 family membrane protein [Blastococcus sp. CCUG 61487]|uniref:TIGR04086 family membrane protein n=1 Tax=Blastococcus sp. CCUG 61487 TaxID=1840703 RepID=UPI0010C05FA3|nr:TIGR04086 family membrane protein [Blastococcus sp. CCUG 61487]TKJ22203.1 hypothetical protein A6V29_06650 [Blastococcus sp. CCUG 61487]